MDEILKFQFAGQCPVTKRAQAGCESLRQRVPLGIDFAFIIRKRNVTEQSERVTIMTAPCTQSLRRLAAKYQFTCYSCKNGQFMVS